MREDEYYEYPVLEYDDEPMKRPPIFAANAHYLFCVVGLVISSIAINFAAFSVTASALKPMVYIVSSFVELSVFAVIPLVYAARNPSTIGAFRLIKPSVSAMVLSALSAIVCVFMSYVIMNLWGIAVEKMGGVISGNGLLIPSSMNDLIALVAVVGVLPGICEEIMFRGMILGAFEGIGGKAALCASSILFAALHASVAGFPAQLMLGFVLGMLALFTGSIYPGIMFHALYNSILLIISYLARDFAGTGLSVTLYESVGGIAGVLQLVMLLVLSASLVAVILFALYRSGAKDRVVFAGRGYPGWRPGSGVVLAAALVTVAFLFLKDIFQVFGFGL